MLLDIKKRLIILSMLPKEGDINDQCLCKDISLKLELSPSCIELVQLKNVDGVISWDNSKEELLSVDFTLSESNFLKALVEELDRNKKANPENLQLLIEIKSL